MKIKKVYQGELPENKIVNTESTSQTDTYSCEYINDGATKLIDITSEFKVTSNATFNKGRIYKYGKLILLMISLKATNTLSWGAVLTISDKYLPRGLDDAGETPIVGTSFWAYSTEKQISGALTTDKNVDLYGYYILKD